ncbi:hypothetical protein APHAL10511_000808 [Amanita phalloides]|nr:hypothetical protein APHAL10511_000808 [Amanita phalloides]
MVWNYFPVALSVLLIQAATVTGHAAIWHPSMYGFNVTSSTFPYDNRPVTPLKYMSFQRWWFHNHLAHPPNPGDIFSLSAGEPATVEIACNKGATSYFASSEGGDIRNPSKPNDVCPGSPMKEYHTNGINDLEGCALAIAYKNDVKQVQPADFTIFSVNRTCVWNRFTDFSVPKRMPACPDGGCICAFFWIHAPDSGGEEMYMNGFKCDIANPTSKVPLAQSKVARRCGADRANDKPQAALGNCTYGAKQPLYWFNLERANMFEGAYSPPVYNELYNFIEGSQDDIFEDSYISLPDPAPNAALPVLRHLTGQGQPNSTSKTAAGAPTRSMPTSPTQTVSSARKKCKFRTTKRAYAGNDAAQGDSRPERWSVMKMTKRHRRLEERESLWSIF